MSTLNLWCRIVSITSVLILVAGYCPAAHGQSLAKPVLLPAQALDYVDYAVNNLPAHFADEVARDSTPADNPITDAGATLGRVLFYDKRLSHNNTMACASCHFQENGFSDPAPTSLQVDGNQTTRHSPALANSRFFGDGILNGRFLTDVSAPTLEAQTLLPIISSELGIGALGDANIATVLGKLSESSFYEDLFLDAFGQPTDPAESVISEDRVAKALAQFVRSMVSYNSKFDTIFDANGNEDAALVAAALTQQEQLGKDLFHGRGQCADCHTGNSQTAVSLHNNGLDAQTIDPGAGNGLFKAVSLRNVEVRGSFMHDGRFESLEEVVEFYSDDIQDNPNLDFRLRENQNQANGPLNINFSDDESAAVVAFLKTLTDTAFLTDERFSDPFVLTCDFDANSICDIHDIDQLLATGPVARPVPVDATNEVYDLNGDGVIDATDAAAWLADAAEANGLVDPYPLGDANLDGTVDEDDFLAWNANRFSASTDWSRGDFNGDGTIDVSDFNIWNTNRADPAAPLSIPEPPSARWPALLLFVLVLRASCRPKLRGRRL